MSTVRAHGTYSKYVMDRCRCSECRGANAAYAARVARLQAYGQWQPLVDAEPVRSHIRSLMAAGIPRRTIVRLADVSQTTLSRALYGRKGEPPSQRMRPQAAAAILAIEVEPSFFGPHTKVDASGTRRRLQALMWAGWTLTQIEKWSGVYRTTLSKALPAETVQHRVAEGVRTAYDQLWDRQPPDYNAAVRRQVACAKAEARRQGYLPAAAWDDDLIDLPDDLMWAALEAEVSTWRRPDLLRAVSASEEGERSPLVVAAVKEFTRRSDRYRPKAGAR